MWVESEQGLYGPVETAHMVIGDILTTTRYATLMLNFENLLNTTSLLSYNGVLVSPVFGTANTSEPGRRVSLGLLLNF